MDLFPLCLLVLKMQPCSSSSTQTQHTHSHPSNTYNVFMINDARCQPSSTTVTAIQITTYAFQHGISMTTYHRHSWKTQMAKIRASAIIFQYRTVIVVRVYHRNALLTVVHSVWHVRCHCLSLCCIREAEHACQLHPFTARSATMLRRLKRCFNIWITRSGCQSSETTFTTCCGLNRSTRLSYELQLSVDLHRKPAPLWWP